MITDILFSLYIILLFPYLYECERLKASGLKYLLLGVLFTPLIGFIFLSFHKKKQLTRRKPLSS